MNFLNVGPLELTVILVIAILLIGPKRMIQVSRTIGRLTRQLRRYSADFTATLQTEVAATERAAGESPKDVIKSIAEPFTALQAEFGAMQRETRQALTTIVEGTAEPIQDELEAMEQDTRQALETAAQLKTVAQNDTNDDPAQEN